LGLLIRTAARNRKAARSAVDAGLAADEFLKDQDFKAALAALDVSDSSAPKGAEQVVSARFGAPLQTTRERKPKQAASAVPQEFLNNMDNAIAAKKARRGKSA